MEFSSNMRLIGISFEAMNHAYLEDEPSCHLLVFGDFFQRPTKVTKYRLRMQEKYYIFDYGWIKVQHKKLKY